MSMSSLQVRDVVSGAIFVLLGGAIWFYADSFPALPEGYPGPALFPRLIAAGLVFSGLLLGVGSRKSTPQREEKTNDPPSPVYFFLGIMLVVLFPFVRAWTGVIPALALLMLGMAVLLKVRLLIAVPTSLAAACLLYAVFSMLLGVPL